MFNKPGQTKFASYPGTARTYRERGKVRRRLDFIESGQS